MSYRNIFIIVLVVILALRLISYYNQKQTENLKGNHKIASGQITKYFQHTKGANGYDYEFYVDAKKYTGWYSKTFYFEGLLYKYFPVVYNPVDPTDNKMLMFFEDFDTYSEIYPDSLRWATKYK